MRNEQNKEKHEEESAGVKISSARQTERAALRVNEAS